MHNKLRLNLKPENVGYLMNIKFNSFLVEENMDEDTVNEEQKYDELIDTFEDN